MTPAEIAARLTPAQVRALRDPAGCTVADFAALLRIQDETGRKLISSFQPFDYTTVGDAVLGALDAKP